MDARFDVELHLIARWPFGSLFELADQVRDRVDRAASAAELEAVLGAISVSFEDVVEPATTIRRRLALESEQRHERLLRTLARIVTVALLSALSLCGLAIAIFSIGGTASGDFSLPGLARLVHLPQLRADIGELYARLEASGSVAGISALCGLGAVVIGVLLLLGVFLGRHERLAILESSGEGTIAARPRVSVARSPRWPSRHEV